jgi:multiple sugar transport system substrate-binding protein
MRRRTLVRLAALAAVAALVTGGCGNAIVTPAPTLAPLLTPAATPRTVATATPTTVPAPPTTGACTCGIVNGHLVVRWFVGLGPGVDPAQIAMQQSVANDFNALQDKRTDGFEPTQLSLEVVENSTAVDILKTEFKADNAPDLIGPASIEDLAAFPGEFLDLRPLIKATGYITDGFPPSLMDTMSDSQTGALLGLPYAVNPSYIFYNRDLFDAAGLKYPPAKVGDRYTMPDGTRVPWNWDTVRRIAMLLSLDSKGRNATQPGFDPTNQVQFGFEFQGTEGRALGSAFGSGSFVEADGKTAQFPDAWKAGWNWYYSGIWTDHFIANGTERNSSLLDKGNPIASGHVAMGAMSQSYTCCMSADTSKPNATLKHWDIAPMPANAAGVTTAPVDIDTIAIYKNSPYAYRAFEAMAYVVSRMDLLASYGGTPATGDQLGFFHRNVDPSLAGQFPGNKVDWQVALDMETHAESPNHEAEMPNNARAVGDYDRLFSSLATTPELDLNGIFADVTTALQADFDAGS